MAAMPLSSTVDVSSSRRPWRRSALSLLCSILIQTLALAALAVVAILSMSALPEPEGRLRLPEFVPVVPVARPERNPTTKPPATGRRQGPRRTFSFPGITPVGIPEEVHDTDWLLETSGVPEGVPGALAGFKVGAPPSAPAEERPEELYRVGGDVAPPRKRHHVDPPYPPIAIQARVEGSVLLEAIIDPEGNVVNVRVLRSIPLLDGAAIDAVRRWRYEPTHLNGKPVPIVMTVTVTFVLRR